MQTELKVLTDDNIAAACELHGAKRVSDAAYRRMNGDRNALPEVGLQDAQNLGDANRITSIAFRLMTPDEAAADLAVASIDAAKLRLKHRLTLRSCASSLSDYGCKRNFFGKVLKI